MNKIREEILRTIELIVRKRLKELNYNYTVSGLITEIIDSETYKVKIYDDISSVKSMNIQEYQVGDVVNIIVFNNNYSNKKILCKM